jgi:hypothetical protein
LAANEEASHGLHRKPNGREAIFTLCDEREIMNRFVMAAPECRRHNRLVTHEEPEVRERFNVRFKATAK